MKKHCVVAIVFLIVPVVILNAQGGRRQRPTPDQPGHRECSGGQSVVFHLRLLCLPWFQR
jgi:uncharacterized protein YdeI (BOF family)